VNQVCETSATDGTGETSRMVGQVCLVCESEGEAKIGYLVTGWVADSMAARILARDSASNSCPYSFMNMTCPGKFGPG
jgi:hypothetical protein